MKRKALEGGWFAVLVLFPVVFPIDLFIRIASGPDAPAPLFLTYGIWAAEIIVGALLLIFLRKLLSRYSKVLATIFCILAVPASWVFQLWFFVFVVLCGDDSGPFTDSTWTVQLQRDSVECGRSSNGPLEESLELRFRLWKSESTKKNWMLRSWNGQWNIQTNDGRNYRGSWSSMDGAIQLGADDKSRLTVFDPDANGKSLVFYSPLGWDDPCTYRGIAAPVHE